MNGLIVLRVVLAKVASLPSAYEFLGTYTEILLRLFLQ